MLFRMKRLLQKKIKKNEDVIIYELDSYQNYSLPNNIRLCLAKKADRG